MRTAGSGRSFKFHLLLWAIALVVVCLASLCIGSVNIPAKELLTIFLSRLTGRPVPVDLLESDTIIFMIRAPRILLSALVGASLAISGAAMQGLIKNPLADGSTLGITSGASLGAVAALGLGLSLPFASYLNVTLLSIVSAFLSLLLILFFAKRIDKNLSSNTIILTGMIFSMLASSLSSLIIASSGDNLKNIVFWQLGSLAGRGWHYVFLMACFCLVGVLGLLRYARELDAFALGEEQARYIGVPVRRARTMILLFVSVLCGAAVSVSGSIGFVGLIIPHIVRALTGPLHTHLLPESALVGAVFLVACDLISRTILQPLELPIGIITSIIGAIVFIFIFHRQAHSKDVNP